jgi:hypothetical protein
MGAGAVTMRHRDVGEGTALLAAVTVCLTALVASTLWMMW